jgi:hypothetical protein
MIQLNASLSHPEPFLNVLTLSLHIVLELRVAITQRTPLERGEVHDQHAISEQRVPVEQRMGAEKNAALREHKLLEVHTVNLRSTGEVQVECRLSRSIGDRLVDLVQRTVAAESKA